MSERECAVKHLNESQHTEVQLQSAEEQRVWREKVQDRGPIRMLPLLPVLLILVWRGCTSGPPTSAPGKSGQSGVNVVVSLLMGTLVLR